MLEQTSIVDLALEYGIDLIEQVGGDYIALCPFHDDKDTPSLRIYHLTNTWYCFGCQQGSSVFDFVMLQEEVEFHEALHKLAARIGYDGTYALKTVKIDEITEKFSTIREKIELAVLQRYLYIYRSKKALGTIDESMLLKIEKFWEWYDAAQVVFDRKAWEGVSLEILEAKLYEFYSKAWQKLNSLSEENSYGT